MILVTYLDINIHLIIYVLYSPIKMIEEGEYKKRRAKPSYLVFSLSLTPGITNGLPSISVIIFPSESKIIPSLS